MTKAEELRQEAARAYRLARSMTDEHSRAALDAIGQELEAQAAEIEANEQKTPKPNDGT